MSWAGAIRNQAGQASEQQFPMASALVAAPTSLVMEYVLGAEDEVNPPPRVDFGYGLSPQ